ncbi:MAG: hypothetical protein H0X34_04690 [Chthoniobacterales bacterium]|nr:hypothetical protein [Chthoniobacterales bacterium]
MNVIQRLTFCAMLVGTVTAWAQAPTNPDNTSAQAARAQEATAEIPAASPTIAPIEPPSLIPPNSLPGPDAASLPLAPAAPELQQLLDLFKKSSLGKTADEHRLHIQMAELETHIRNDEDLHQLKRSAQGGGTDLERRHWLRAYYELYYRKLRARAETPELRDYLAAQAASHELTLLQPRVRHNTDEAEAAKLALARGGTAAAPLATPSQAKVNNVFHP